jgi:hypothetical protein
VPVAVLRAAAAAAGSPYVSVSEGPFEDFDEENSAIAAAALRLVAGSKGLERLDEVTFPPRARELARWHRCFV